jgi:serine/threonine protein kinase/tetratricopeptide (TPR) repeat protein
MFVRSPTLVIGQTLSRYRIVSHLGSGSMGDVYRAEDLRLGRPVALKLLRAPGGPEGLQRLVAEARAASAFNHPNSAVVYEVDEVERDGIWDGFIAMEYVAGRSLADLSSQEPLSLDAVLDIARQVADALAEAHTHGLVHRDIKPSNVMVTPGGLVKVLDFGIARPSVPAVETIETAGTAAPTRSGDSASGVHDIVGTLPYMSPEQATGRPLDGRSDMFSLGVVLYELLAGRRPFEGENGAQLLEAILQKDPRPLLSHLDDPRLPSVEHIIRRMLEKSPVGRYEDLRAVSIAFAAVRRGETPIDSAVGSRPPSLAITDFRNITANAEDDWLGTGIAETISADLSGLSEITIVPRARVQEMVRALAPPSGDAEGAVWIRAGRALGATWVLTGSFQRAGEAVRVTASLLEVGTGEAARTVKVDGRLAEIFPLQDRLVRELADGLRTVSHAGGASPPETGSAVAYEAFSKGLVNLRAETYESLDRAVTLFERAVALDPRYARAHLELGVAYSTKADYLAIPDLWPRAMASLRRALELQPESVRAWRELGAVLVGAGHDKEGFDAIQHALHLDPADAGAIGTMARALFIGRADVEAAASWFERALAANPSAGWYALQLSHCAALLRDFARGEAAAHRAIALQQASLSGREGALVAGASMRLGHLKALQGLHTEAIAHFLRELEFLATIDHALRGRITVEINVRLGASYLASGQNDTGQAALDVAIEAFDRRIRLGADDPFTRYYTAAAYALRGDADTAVVFLERAAAERRAFTLERARIEPEFDAIRHDARFRRLLLANP